MNAALSIGADLHLHSYYSDGTFSPREVVAQAAARRLNPIALTDHDTVDGVAEALQASADLQVHVIPGIELSVHEFSQDIHILGYCLRWDDTTFRASLLPLQARRHERLEEIVRRLQQRGISLSVSDVMRIAGKGTVGRLHVARALLAQRAVSSLQEAFDRFLARGRPAYVEPVTFTAHQAIRSIRSVEGIPVLAHPGAQGLARLTDLMEAGLQGIEVFHPSHTAEEVFTLTRIATERGLLITGGSDCHGLAKGMIRLGQIRLPLQHVERLCEAAPSLGIPEAEEL